MGEVEATIRSLRLRAAISTLELEANELPNSEDVTRAQPGALFCWVNKGGVVDLQGGKMARHVKMAIWCFFFGDFHLTTTN